MYGGLALMWFLLGIFTGFGLCWGILAPLERARILRRLAAQGINHIHRTRAEMRRCEYCRPTDKGPRHVLAPRHECGMEITPSPNAIGTPTVRVPVKVVPNHQGERSR